MDFSVGSCHRWLFSHSSAGIWRSKFTFSSLPSLDIAQVSLLYSLSLG